MKSATTNRGKQLATELPKISFSNTIDVLRRIGFSKAGAKAWRRITDCLHAGAAGPKVYRALQVFLRGLPPEFEVTATHSQLAYRHLRSRLIAGEFAPGSRIRYGPIGQELGISATPVREAMGLLANEGFVELVPQLGAIVRTISREQLIELYEMREAIEPYAAAKAAERAGEEQVASIGRTLDRMTRLAEKVARSKTKRAGKRDTAEFEKADLAFHMLIIDATGNQTMIRSGESSNALVRVFATQRHAYDAEIMLSTCDDHRCILTAIRCQNCDQARDAMQQHIVSGLRITLQALQADNAKRWENS